MSAMKLAIAVIAAVPMLIAACGFIDRRDALPPLQLVAGKSIAPYQHGLMITATTASAGCAEGCEVILYIGHTAAEAKVFWRVQTTVPVGRAQPDPLPAIRGIVCQETGKPDPDFANCTIPFDVLPGVQEGNLPVMLNEFVHDPYGVKAHLALWVGGKPQLPSEPSPPMAKMATTMSVIPVVNQ